MNNKMTIEEQLSTKRQVLFCLGMSACSLICGWPFPAPGVFSLLTYRTTWAVLTLALLVITIAVDGNLWLLRNEGKTPADYYARKHWWLHALDWELHFCWLRWFEKSRTKGGRS
ncbi:MULTISPECIES: hypothetical protein [Burkholderia]|uniref:hypothetical protein n=1 Tax=Burkholderia TaxID=32008 RepID=UPI00064EF867|nr:MULTISPECIES: hypothetical protein [Burkholderia]KML04094.1 hypothetical protein VL00_29990 [Burkholderia cepacia]KML39945.1 hypothetical protein VL13_17230 [Burkholderia lata]KMN58320.1 hypothetical protein VK92_22140 [Burkholderia sp. LK4]